MTKFQLILTGIFGAFILIGVMFFSMSSGRGQSTAYMVVWGTMPQSTWSNVLAESNLVADRRFSLQYVEIRESEFDSELIRALSENRGPDLVIASHERILSNSTRMVPIPYESMSERQFRTAYVEAGEVFLRPAGFLAFPMYLDPMVMFWNRDILATGGLVSPPAFWDEFYNFAAAFTVRDGAFNIVREAVALGEYANIMHAKDILSLLIMQAGGNIVSMSSDGSLSSVLSDRQGQVLVPANAALLFYTEFSNPTKPHYSWNRSLGDSLSEFSAGDLALYFGYASELSLVREKNPNLNFDVATLPQVRTAERPVSFGRVYAVAIPRGSHDLTGAFIAALALTDNSASSAVANLSGLVPARRELISSRPNDAFREVFYDSAIRMKVWNDILPDVSAGIWREMIESVTSGRARVEEAVLRGGEELDRTLRLIRQ